MRDILIGIDAGTSVLKSVAFDLGGRQIAAHAIPNQYDTFDGAGATQDMARTWADCAATLRGLAEEVPGLAKRAAAIAVTGQGDGTWLIDRSGVPVGPGWLWLDARAASIVDEIRADQRDRARFEKTGSGLAACQQGPQLIWMKQHMPEAVQKAAHGFHCKDWLYLNLTGEVATDPTEGVFTFGDFRTRNYDSEVIEILGLTGERHLMPEIVDGVSVSHPLSHAGAAATGLLAGTPVVLGYVDVACTALGAGLFDKKALPGCTIIGTTGMHMRLAATPDDVILNADRTGYTIAMPAPGVYAQMQSNMVATLNIDWVLSLAAGVLAEQGVKKSHSEMLGLVDGWVSAAKPAGLLYQPFISEAGERGPFIDADARAGFIGLSMKHGFGDLVRAVVEGLALSARDCYLASGALPKEVRLTGGAARSKSLRQILAAALGADVRTSSREEAGAAGAAMIAAVSIGLYKSMEDCAAEWVTPLLGEAEKPDAALAESYAKIYPAYAAAHQALRCACRNAPTCSVKATGCSMLPRWAALASTTSRAPAMRSVMTAAAAGGTAESASPAITSVGTLISCSRSRWSSRWMARTAAAYPAGWVARICAASHSSVSGEASAKARVNQRSSVAGACAGKPWRANCSSRRSQISRTGASVRALVWASTNAPMRNG